MITDSLATAPARTISSVNEHVRSETINSALQRREWSLTRRPHGHTRHVILLTAGSGQAAIGSRAIHIKAPSVTWLHSAESARLALQAGATGHLLGMSHEVLGGSFGNHPESANLRYMIDQSFNLTLSQHSQTALQRSCAAIDYELRHGGRASWMILTAHFNLIAVEIWRLSGAEDIALKSQGSVSAILQRFRQLVEVNFRNHWTIKTYANEIGISHDRLHAICTRKLGRKPLALVHERLGHEGRILLEHSSLTVEQIAHSLGFKDATHFSHFFKRLTKTPPSRYRQQIQAKTVDAAATAPVTFSDWP
jgi:AraC-like DNA-binding protein